MCEFEGFGAGRLRSILCQSVRFATSPRIPQHHGYSPHIPAQFSFSVHTPRRARTRSTSKICLLVCSYSDDIEVFFVRRCSACIPLCANFFYGASTNVRTFFARRYI